MEAVVAQSLYFPKISSYSCLPFKTSVLSHQSAKVGGVTRLNLQCMNPITQRKLGVVCASEGATSATAVQGWLLEPVGDGDWKHIGFKVDMPSAYEIFSEQMIVGRVPEKADLVIPVATVSGVHARIENKEGNLYVSDMDSTNGTFINEKRVPPGATAAVPPGSLLTFGDSNLAIFRVQKIEKMLDTKEEEDITGETAIQTDATS
ncbi:unnamed protein product [Amaranthus hypochondriacus]